MTRNDALINMLSEEIARVRMDVRDQRPIVDDYLRGRHDALCYALGAAGGVPSDIAFAQYRLSETVERAPVVRPVYDGFRA